MKKSIEGKFKILDFFTHGSPKVILEKDGIQYFVSLKRIKHLIIGKEYVELRLYKTPSGSWCYWPSNNTIWVREDGKWINREKQTISGIFNVYNQHRTSKASAQRIVLQNHFSGKLFDVFLKDVFNILPNIYSKQPIILKEHKQGQAIIWKPSLAK